MALDINSPSVALVREWYRVVVDALMTLEFLGDATNVVLVGPNGVGNSVISPHWTAIPRCVAACDITPARSC